MCIWPRCCHTDTYNMTYHEIKEDGSIGVYPDWQQDMIPDSFLDFVYEKELEYILRALDSVGLSMEYASSLGTYINRNNEIYFAPFAGTHTGDMNETHNGSGYVGTGYYIGPLITRFHVDNFGLGREHNGRSYSDIKNRMLINSPTIDNAHTGSGVFAYDDNQFNAYYREISGKYFQFFQRPFIFDTVNLENYFITYNYIVVAERNYFNIHLRSKNSGEIIYSFMDCFYNSPRGNAIIEYNNQKMYEKESQFNYIITTYYSRQLVDEYPFAITPYAYFNNGRFTIGFLYLKKIRRMFSFSTPKWTFPLEDNSVIGVIEQSLPARLVGETISITKNDIRTNTYELSGWLECHSTAEIDIGWTDVTKLKMTRYFDAAGSASINNLGYLSEIDIEHVYSNEDPRYDKSYQNIWSIYRDCALFMRPIDFSEGKMYFTTNIFDPLASYGYYNYADVYSNIYSANGDYSISYYLDLLNLSDGFTVYKKGNMEIKNRDTVFPLWRSYDSSQDSFQVNTVISNRPRRRYLHGVSIGQYENAVFDFKEIEFFPSAEDYSDYYFDINGHKNKINIRRDLILYDDHIPGVNSALRKAYQYEFEIMDLGTFLAPSFYRDFRVVNREIDPESNTSTANYYAYQYEFVPALMTYNQNQRNEYNRDIEYYQNVAARVGNVSLNNANSYTNQFTVYWVRDFPVIVNIGGALYYGDVIFDIWSQSQIYRSRNGFINCFYRNNGKMSNRQYQSPGFHFVRYKMYDEEGNALLLKGEETGLFDRKSMLPIKK